MAAVNDNIQESVAGISVAKNFRREYMVYGEFVDINNQSYTVNLKRGFVLALIFPVLNATAGFGTGSVVYFGAMAVIGGAINAVICASEAEPAFKASVPVASLRLNRPLPSKDTLSVRPIFS